MKVKLLVSGDMVPWWHSLSPQRAMYSSATGVVRDFLSDRIALRARSLQSEPWSITFPVKAMLRSCTGSPSVTVSTSCIGSPEGG